MPDLDSIYFAASELPPADRAAYLDEACQGDHELRKRVEGMLAIAHEAEAFITDAPAIDLGTRNSPEGPGKTVKLAAAADLPDEIIGQRIGRYKILERVGEGGCGVVYVAEQTEPVRRRVALKVIKLGMDTKQVVARFEAEQQALAIMDHPNIAKVLDAGATDLGRPYFVMELVRGIKITDYCDQARLATKERLDLFIQVCRAIQHAHQKGIIHRDIKPSNILVTLHDGVPVPKVIDFGISKAIEGRLTEATVYTQLHQFIGTPAYMSPEQAEMSGLDIDTRSDIYSLGVLLYELLVGITPFNGQELMSHGIDAMRRIIREQEPPRPSTKLATLQGEAMTTTAKHRSVDTSRLAKLLQGDLDWIVMKCLEKDRQRRYDTANGLAADLQRFLASEPVLARPPSATDKLQKAFRRNKLAFTAGAAVLAALVIGLGVATWMFVLERQAHHQAAAAEQEQSRLRAAAQTAQAEALTNAEKFRDEAARSRRNEYAADLFAATTELEKGNYGNARNYLREFLPQAGLEELRGFEWRNWWQLSGGEQLKTLQVDPRQRILNLVWSPDGRRLAAGNGDRTAILLDADTGATLLVLTNYLRSEQVCVSFTFDGQEMVTTGDHGLVRCWDARDGHLIFNLTNERPNVACSPVAPIMAIGNGGDWWGQRGKDVNLVDTTSGRMLKVLTNAGDRAAFSRDGKRLATANWNDWNSGLQAVKIWDVDSGQQLGVLENVRQALGLAFSPDGTVLAIGTRQGALILWPLDSTNRVTLREPTGEYARSVTYSPDGRWLAVALQNHQVEIWDPQAKRLVETLHGHASEVTSVSYSPDGRRLASSSYDGTIRFWAPQPPTLPVLIPEVAVKPIGFPKFSPDSRWLATATTNGDVEIVDSTTTGWNMQTLLTNAGFPIGFCSDISTLLTLDPGGETVQEWNIPSGTLRFTSILDSTNGPWEVSAASADGSRLALATRDFIEVFETRTGRVLDKFRNPPPVECLEFSRDGKLLAIAGERVGLLRDTSAGRFVWTLAGHTDRVTAIRFSPDQKTIATSSWDSTARLWDAANGKLLAVLTGHKQGVLDCVFAPDSRSLITGSDDKMVKFWNVATGRDVATIRYDSYISCLVISPDGRILAASHRQGGFRCWGAPTLAEIDAADAKQKVESKSP